MKIAVTGHTKGIGQAIYNLLGQEHDVIGYSRSNGYNINKPEIIFEEAKDFDIFINNAQSKDAQLQLFNLFWQDWRYKEKTIVNIGSSSYYPETKSKFGSYVINKQELHNRVKQACLTSMNNGNQKCRVTNIIAGWTDTDMVKMLRIFKKMDPQIVAKNVKYCIDQPQDIQIFELAIWHHPMKANLR